MNPTFSNSDYDRLDATLLLADTGHNASEVHGIICGAICNQLKSGRQVDVMNLVIAVAGISNESKGALEASIDSLYESSQQCLDDRNSSFSLLIPDDDHALVERTEAIAQWCQGFVIGLLSNQAFTIDKLPANVAEIAQDFMAIAKAEPGEDREQDEWALAEIEEYVRVGVQLIFEELQHDVR
jgi:uncharacterized protein YgfB (UPF0149 family)